MSNDVKQRLCGGTFFTLFLRARKPLLGANIYYTGKPEPYSEPIALFALSKVIAPDWTSVFDYKKSTVNGNTSEYKTCKNDGGWLFPFSDDAEISAFDSRVKEHYETALGEMCNVVDLFINKGSAQKDKRLVKELLSLISLDDSISDDQLFFTAENGKPITKQALLQSSSFCMQPFLLGIWHFAVTRPEKNTFGQETINLWCPSTGGGKREYKGHLLELYTKTFTIEYCLPPDTIAEEEATDAIHGDAIEAEIVEDRTEKQQSESTSSGTTQQVINNNPTFFNFNVSGNNNTFVNHVDTLYTGNGGKKE